MKNPLLRFAPAVALAAPLALGLYARPSAQTQTQAPAQPSSQAPEQPQTQPQPDAQGQPAPATPTFRAGINFVRVDVTVSDKKGNAVTDLRQQDFEVTEDGKPQIIQTFKLIDIKESSLVEPVEVSRHIKTVADEQMEAAKDETRLFGIFLDDYHVRKENSMRAREPIARFIENLQPNDMAGIMYPLTPLDDVLLTKDHANVASAIRSFLGRKYEYTARNLFEERYVNYVSTMEAERIRNQVSLSAIKAMIVHMGGLKEGRKSLILITEGWTNSLPSQVQDQIASQPQAGSRPPDPVTGKSSREQSQDYFDQAEMLGDIRLVYEMANRYNTMIYAVDPRGLAVFEFDLSRSNVSTTSDQGILNNTMDTLRVLASETGGRAIVNQNDLETGLKQIVRDSSAYYLLGYTTTQNAVDGKFHQIKVNVKRSNVDVHARKGYLALTTAEAERAIAPPKPGPPKAISDALGTLAVPTRRSPIRTWIGMSPGSNGKTKVSFVWEATPAPPGVRTETPTKVSLIVGAPNNDLYYRGKIAGDTQPARAEFEVPPGPVDLEIAIEDANADVIDRETRKLVVPSLGPGLSMTTPAVYRARTVKEWQTLAADTNPIPMPVREFRRTDRLLVRVGVQGSGGTPTVTAKLLNRDGAEMNALTTSAASPGFTNIDVPLANLATGDFLIEVTASDGGEKTTALIAIRVTA
jgi:VWFA-related protein